MGGRPSNVKAAISPNRAAIARRAEARQSHDSPSPPGGSRRVPSPPSTAKNKNAESRAHHPNLRRSRLKQQLSGALATRPMKARTSTDGCDAETKKNRAGERRDHRLTAHTDHFLAVEEHGRRPHRTRGLPGDVRHLRRRYADARAHSSTRARGDARTFITPDAAGPIANAAPHAYAVPSHADVRAVRIVRRRRDVVLRHEGLEHLRLRRPQTQTLQSQEHGRSENSTRGLPRHLRHLLESPVIASINRHHRKLIGPTPGQQLQEPLVHGVLELDEAPVLAQRAGHGRRRGHRQRQPRGPDDLAQREGHGQRRRAV